MTAKGILKRVWDWLLGRDLTSRYRPEVDSEGLIPQQDISGSNEQNDGQQSKVIVTTLQQLGNQSLAGRLPAESLEKLQTSFDKLIEQLRAINDNLNRQGLQQDELMGQIKQLPKVLEGFPDMVESQKQITMQLAEQYKASALRGEQFIEIVEKIPAETAKQSDKLMNIEHQMAASADIDVQMAESFNSFNKTLDKLNQAAVSQADSIDNMSRTFATSDRYLKYIISQQSKRFMWIFIIAVSICAVVIVVLTGIIVFLRYS